MMKFSNILILLLIVTGFCKADSLSVYPGFYYTYGDYSSIASSKSFSGYLPLVLNGKHTLVLGYDNLKINTPDWIYDQQTFNAGTIFSLDPFYLKFNYAYLNGDYSENTGYNYKDKTNILNPEIIIRTGNVYAGISYVYLKLNGGIIQRTSNQFTGRLDWIASQRIYLSLKPGYVKISDGRSLTSLTAKMHFLPVSRLLLKAGGMIGKRAYYFDSDILTLFNQDETQTGMYFGQIEWTPVNKFTLIFSAQHTNFETFSINYIVAGFKTNFTF